MIILVLILCPHQIIIHTDLGSNIVRKDIIMITNSIIFLITVPIIINLT